MYADPEAVHVALVNCPCPIVFFPLDVTHKALFRNDIELVRLNNKRTNHRLVIETAVDFFRGTYASLFGFTSPPCHDVLTSAFAIRPDLFTLQQARLTVETLDDDHRGKLVRCEGEQQGTLVQVAMDVDIAGMWDLFFDALEKSEASVSSD